MKTYTIESDYSPTRSGFILQYRLTRYGKTLRNWRVAPGLCAEPEGVWQLRREAEKMGATHIFLAGVGLKEKV